MADVAHQPDTLLTYWPGTVAAQGPGAARSDVLPRCVTSIPDINHTAPQRITTTRASAALGADKLCRTAGPVPNAPYKRRIASARQVLDAKKVDQGEAKSEAATCPYRSVCMRRCETGTPRRPAHNTARATGRRTRDASPAAHNPAIGPLGWRVVYGVALRIVSVISARVGPSARGGRQPVSYTLRAWGSSMRITSGPPAMVR
jgi:hypothetical protein